MVLRRLHIEQDRHRQRSQRPAREALDDAGEHELHRRDRDRVEHQAEGEDGERDLRTVFRP
jgi:hypothetical protein